MNVRSFVLQWKSQVNQLSVDHNFLTAALLVFVKSGYKVERFTCSYLEHLGLLLLVYNIALLINSLPNFYVHVNQPYTQTLTNL